MLEKRTFDLTDITNELMKEIIFVDIAYPGMVGPGCVIFITESGEEYVISQQGTDLTIVEIVKLIPNIYDIYSNKDKGKKYKYGYAEYKGWKIMPEFAGVFLIRKDFFEKFYSIYQTESVRNQEFPIGIARTLFGRKQYVVWDETIVYIKTQEYWDKELQKKIEREQKIEKNRLQDCDVPWMRYRSFILEGYVKFWIKKDVDGTLTGFRWLIQLQKEQFEEGGYKANSPVECYNLLIKEYTHIQEYEIMDLDYLYTEYINNSDAGKFVRSYKTLEEAQKAVEIRNEWIGWGNVNKENVYMLDYEYLKQKLENDEDVYFF